MLLRLPPPFCCCCYDAAMFVLLLCCLAAAAAAVLFSQRYLFLSDLRELLCKATPLGDVFAHLEDERQIYQLRELYEYRLGSVVPADVSCQRSFA